MTYSVTDIFRQPFTLTSTDSGSCFLSAAGLALGNQTGQMESTKANRIDVRIQRQNRDFLKTFSDAQASGLKKQTKKLTQSDAAVGKEAKKLSAQLERTSPDPQGLHQAAVHLDQALATLQSDQNGLAKGNGDRDTLTILALISRNMKSMGLTSDHWQSSTRHPVSRSNLA